ncbi:hypothetical protein MNBD_BACTEROID03-862 [hydrothermal vent metagenome]|uniref:Uncharacterized protein n=1 Tax=hydrothermal vent metagenome TaxID=652676 RepID=A0A3B0SXH3_9ZZZZ
MGFNVSLFFAFLFFSFFTAGVSLGSEASLSGTAFSMVLRSVEGTLLFGTLRFSSIASLQESKHMESTIAKMKIWGNFIIDQ